MPLLAVGGLWFHCKACHLLLQNNQEEYLIIRAWLTASLSG
jgi:hypothetical protein